MFDVIFSNSPLLVQDYLPHLFPPLARIFIRVLVVIARKTIKQTNQKQNDTHNNPVEEGLVFKPEQYVYSSSIDYAGGKGLLDIFY